MNHTEESLYTLISNSGITISDELIPQLIHHLQLVLDKNKEINLTAVRSLEDGLILHILDSLTYTIMIGDVCAGSILDIGTGAGFPGIPLAIYYRDALLTLCDSVKKKITAVTGFVDTLGLSDRVSTTHQRVEELATQGYRYSHVVARAVAPLSALIEYATPVLQPDGLLIVSKGQPREDELTQAQTVAELCSLQLIRQQQISLPNDYGIRTLFCYQRVGNPKIQLPRQAGFATKRPLA